MKKSNLGALSAFWLVVMLLAPSSFARTIVLGSGEQISFRNLSKGDVVSCDGGVSNQPSPPAPVSRRLCQPLMKSENHWQIVTESGIPVSELHSFNQVIPAFRKLVADGTCERTPPGMSCSTGPEKHFIINIWGGGVVNTTYDTYHAILDQLSEAGICD